MWRQLPPWLIWSLRVLVAAVFIYAGAQKIIDPIRFSVDIENYRIVGWPIAVRLAFYLPWLEIICGLGLLFWRLASGASLILTSLLCAFIVASISAKMRGIDISCGCFGHAGRSLTFAGHLLIDVGLLAVAVFLFWRQRPAAA